MKAVGDEFDSLYAVIVKYVQTRKYVLCGVQTEGCRMETAKIWNETEASLIDDSALQICDFLVWAVGFIPGTAEFIYGLVGHGAIGEFPHQVWGEGCVMCACGYDGDDLACVPEGGGQQFGWEIVAVEIFRDLADEVRTRNAFVLNVVDIWRKIAGTIFRRQNGLCNGVYGGGCEWNALAPQHGHCLEALQCDWHFHIEVAWYAGAQGDCVLQHFLCGASKHLGVQHPVIAYEAAYSRQQFPERTLLAGDYAGACGHARQWKEFKCLADVRDVRRVNQKKHSRMP